MKTTILTSVLFSLSVLAFGQKTPNLTQTASRSTSTTSTSKSSNGFARSVSTIDDDDNSSIAISESDDSYKLRAKYSSKKDKAIKELLVSEFGKNNMEKDGRYIKWNLESENDDIYLIKLHSGKLHLELDKKNAAPSLIQKFKQTGKAVKETLTSGTKELQGKVGRLQQDAIRLRGEAKRLKNGNEENVTALKAEAERLQEKVDSLRQELKKQDRK